MNKHRAEIMADQIEYAYQTYAEMHEELDQLKREKAALEDRVTALVEALNYVERNLSIDDFGNYCLSTDFDADKIRAALKAAGVATEGGLEDTL